MQGTSIDTTLMLYIKLNAYFLQVKLLEDKNTSYMERTIVLEDELKKANVARSQLDASKRQVLLDFVLFIVMCFLLFIQFRLL